MSRTVLTSLAVLLALIPTLGCKRSHVDLGRGETPLSEGTLKNAQQEDLWTYYYDSGAIRSRGSYVDDVQDGEWTTWHENGNKKSEGRYERERRVGVWTYWHASGARRAQGRFDRGRESGRWTFWDSAGSLEKRGDFDQGERALSWTYWHPGGRVRAEGYILDGEKVGLWRYWDEAGERSEVMEPMTAGWSLYRESWEGSEASRREGFLLDGAPAGIWIASHPGGERRAEGRFVGGRLGDIVAWDEAGQPVDAPAALRADLASAIVPTRVVVFTEPSVTPPVRVEDSSDMEPEAPIHAQNFTVTETAKFEEFVVAFGENPDEDAPDPAGRYGGGGMLWTKGDHEKAEKLLGIGLPWTRFRTAAGGQVDLARYKGKKKVLMVILRGFAGQVCVYCCAQTAALAESFDSFEKLNTEVVILYPGTRGESWEAFLDAYRQQRTDPPPYECLFDPDLELAAALEIRGNLTLPSAVILDEEGLIRYAYVGGNRADRVSARELLDVIEAMPAIRP